MPPPDQEGTNAFNIVREVSDFYFNNFHRHSWDGNERQILVAVDVGNLRNNAAFLPHCGNFAFGDRMITRDVVAHEFTHGVTETTAGLVYLNQSGALNESYSDVMAAMIDAANWTIGEDSVAGTFRDLQDPPRFMSCNPLPPNDCAIHPDHMDDYRNITWDHGGVHINSGIPNRVAALIAEGGTHHCFLIRGLGRAKTARLYYDVLTTRLTRNSRFIDAAHATVQQAKDYVSQNLYSFNPQDISDVARAFEAAGLPTPDASGLSPAEFIQVRAIYQRASDGFEVGSEIIPPGGFFRDHIAPDRRIIIAVTAADNETGVESITIAGQASVQCQIGPLPQGDLFHSDSDEVRNGTATPGHPIIRTAHFTLNPDGLSCVDPLASVVFKIQINNGDPCVTLSEEIAFGWGR